MNRILKHRAPPNRAADLGRPVRGLGATLALAVLLVGVPWGLVRFTDWPVTGVPTWDQIRDLPTTAASDAVIVGVFVVVLWGAWLLFAMCVLLEAAAQIRGRTAARLPGAGLVQNSARSLVASVAMTIGSLSSLGSQRPALAETPAPVVAVVDHAVVSPPPTAGHSEVPRSDGSSPVSDQWGYVSVGSGDTVWDIAERCYGDGIEAHRLWQDNRDQVQPDGRRWSNEADPVEPGWVLRVRTTADVAPPSHDGTVVTVRRGDHLWSIAEDQLSHHLGRQPTTDEIATYWAAAVSANRDRIASGNPDLVYAGEQILLPPLPDVEPAPPAPAPPPEQAGTPAPQPPPVPDPTTPETTAPTTTTTASTTTVAPTAESTSVPAPSGKDHNAPPDAEPPGGAGDDGSARDRPDVLVPVGVSAALAALTLYVLARRRRARWRLLKPGVTTPLRPPIDVDMERDLAARAGDAAGRAWWAVRQLAHPFRTLADPPTVTGLLVGTEGDVFVYLSAPAAPDDPFVQHPDYPTVWWLPGDLYDGHDQDVDEVPVLETLVAVGTTDDGSQVFLDLESLGAVSIDGDISSARALLRSLVAELALQPLNHCVDMIVAGDIQPPRTGSQGLVIVDRLDETLVRQVERTADDTANFLADEQAPSTAVGRALGLPRDALVSVIVAADETNDPVLLSRLAKAASPGGWGLTLLAVHPLDERAVQLIVPGDGTVHIPHLGLTAQAAGLSGEDVNVMEGLVNREPETVSPAEAVGLIATVDVDSYEEPAWQFCVRVFADCRVEQPDGTTVSFRHGENPDAPNRNTARGPELLAYLAVRSERSATLAEIRDHLWWGKPVNDHTIHPMLTGTRRVLGGTAYLSHAKGHHGPRRYELGPSVISDVDLLEHALDFAGSAAARSPDIALAVLEPHIERLQAPAFRDGHLGGGIDEWAAANRVHDRIELPVINAALLAAALHENLGHPNRDALRVLDQALTVRPTNEALIRAAMVLEAKSGDREAALRRYHALASELARDELEPEPETTELRKRIMGGDPLD